MLMLKFESSQKHENSAQSASSSFEPAFLTTAWPHSISGQMLSSHSIVSSFRTVRSCSPWGSRYWRTFGNWRTIWSTVWIGHWRTTWSTVCSSAPHSQVAEEATPRLYRQGGKRPALTRRQWSRTQALLGRVAPGMLLLSDKLMGCCAAGTNGCLDLRRHAFALDGQGSAEWSRCPGSMVRSPRDCGSFVMKLSRLDACEDWKVVRWSRTQASSHDSQGVVNSGVDKAGMSTVAPDRSAVLCSWIHLGKVGCSQSCCSSTLTRASEPSHERDAWCQLLVKWLKVSAVRERPVQRYSEVFGLGAEGQGFVVEVDFQLTFSFLLDKTFL